MNFNSHAGFATLALPGPPASKFRAHVAASYRSACCALCCLLLAGCTPIKMIRTEPPTSFVRESDSHALPEPDPQSDVFLKCETGRAKSGENLGMLENYGDYLIGYAEFDDQGWAYDNDRQIDALQQRLSAELNDPTQSETDFLVMVFIHGWHHNARDNDCNVQEFRQMVRIASAKTKEAIQHHQLVRPRRVIGVYVGWRGESVNAWLLRYTTVIDRRDSAERVAKGSVRKLLADIHDAQLDAQMKGAHGRPDKMRTVVIGHSFGGLIAFAALSQGLLNDFTRLDLDRPHPCNAAEAQTLSDKQSPVWPDGLVLINPAFEATRFEPLHRLMARRVPCTPDGGVKPQRLVVPNVLVVTADNDHWTGGAFTAGRAVSTLFEGYDRTNATATANERTANLHAVGFTPPYETHELTLPSNDPLTIPVAVPLPAHGGTPNTDSPIWVIRAPPSIIEGHSGFLYARPHGAGKPTPYLANWLMALYAKDCAAAPQMTGCQ